MAKPLVSSQEEVTKIRENEAKIESASLLAFLDQQFLLRDELRPVRLQLELLKPEILLQEHHIDSTIVFFGSARIPEHHEAEENLHRIQSELQQRPDDVLLKKALTRAEQVIENSRYIEEARRLAYIISKAYGSKPGCKFVVATGGGPSFMEAANRGAHDAGVRSIAFNIMLPHEQQPNRFVTPDLTFQFHYFAIRKMHFFIRAHAMIAFPGGFGTFDELFDALTLMQTHKMQRIPIILFGKRYWNRVLNFEAMQEEGMIDEDDLNLFHYVETAEEAWQLILDFYQL